MDCLLQQREIGHRPRALRLSLASNESLVRRLVNDKCLESHVPASASAFDDVGKHIICAGEDHRLRLWDAHSGVLVKCFDPGAARMLGGAISCFCLVLAGQQAANFMAPASDIRHLKPDVLRGVLQVTQKQSPAQLSFLAAMGAASSLLGLLEM